MAYCLNGIPLQEVDSQKDLGVWITTSLKPSLHCTKIAKSAMSVLYLVKRAFSAFDEDCFAKVFRTFVRPQLEFAIQAWRPWTAKDLSILERVQRRATKLVAGQGLLPYATRFTNLDLFPLSYRPLRGVLIQAFRIIRGQDCSLVPGDFFELATTTNLRGHPFKLRVTGARLDTRKFFFSNRVLEAWNALPLDVVMSASVEAGWPGTCIDYRQLNKVTVRDSFPIPRIDDTIDALVGASWFASLDLSHSYWQIEVRPEHRHKTAFILPTGLYQFNTLPMGLANATATCQRLMQFVLRNLLPQSCLVYLDDIIIHGKSVSHLLQNLSLVLQELQAAGLTINPKKCHFLQRQVTYLGHVVDETGITPDPEKIRQVLDWPTPQSQTDVQSFLGLASYYCRFIYGFANIALPLHRLTEKGRSFVWTAECTQAFLTLKNALTSAPILALPDGDVQSPPFILDTDASGFAIGAVLSQIAEDGHEHVIAYASQCLDKVQRHYSSTRREMLALVTFVKKFRHLLLAKHFIVRTDHQALKWLRNFKDAEGQVARWRELLEEFDFEVQYRPGKRHNNADTLSRPPLPPTRTPNDAFPVAAIQISQAAQEQWAQMQASDPNVSLIYDRQLHGSPKPTAREMESLSWEAHCLWSMWPFLRLIDNILFFQHRPSLPNRLVVPRTLRPQVIRATHEELAHCGQAKTLAAVRQRYWWPDQRRDVVSVYQTCQTCTQIKDPVVRPRAPLEPMSAGFPNHRIGLDIIGPLFQTKKGNRFILVIVDYFTKCIVKTRSSPLHPAGNGQTERTNKTLVAFLRSLVDQSSADSWDDLLPRRLLDYRATIHSSTSFSRHMMLFGRDLRLSSDVLSRRTSDCKPYDIANQKAKSLLEDRQSYVPCESNPMKTLRREINATLLAMENSGAISPIDRRMARAQETALARFYGLPKVHKEGAPLRPIVSLKGTPTYGLAKWLFQRLKFLTSDSNTTVSSSTQFLEKLKGDLAIETIELLLREKYDETENRLGHAQIIQLLKFCLETYFILDGTIYKQVTGMPIRSPISGLIAEVVLQRLESLVFRHHRPKFWARYGDDTFVVIERDQVLTFKEQLNAVFPDIQFTMEEEENNQLAFLDVLVCRKDCGGLKTKVFRKAANTTQILNFNSNHPISHKRRCRRRSDWISGRTLQLSAQTARARSRNDDYFRQLRKMTSKSVRDDRKQYWAEIATSMEQASNVGDTRKLYRLIRQVSGKPSTLSDSVRDVNGPKECRLGVKSPQIETKFRSRSASNAVETAGRVLDSILFPTAVVERELKNLKEAKSSGPDNIPAKFLKELANELSRPLAHIFRSSFELGKLPSEWKTANIFPIYKGGARTNANNYRPVSLTCICCKIMEAIVKKAAMEFLEQGHLISDLQYGFRQNRSCLSSLLLSTEQWTRALDEDGRVDVIYTDFKKAFESVPHKRLIYKLSEIAIRGRLLTWIIDFLTGRSQTVCIEASRSTPTPVLSGVPQGSVLGPLLFLVYINDCVDDLGCSAIMFADDVKLWRPIRSDADRYALQDSLNRLNSWSTRWLLNFNVDKCVVLRLRTRQTSKEDDSFQYVLG
nr:unnamed protein product [Spirometra erinaceieuropaei]